MSVRTAVKPSHSLTLKRRLKAAPAKVFAAWTDPEKVKRWMGPGEVKVIYAESDPRAGGRYRWHMQGPAGDDHDVSGVYREVIADEKIGKLSIVGVGMRSHPGVAAKMFETLANENVNIGMISTSEIKISVVIDLAKAEQAVKAVHAAFVG